MAAIRRATGSALRPTTCGRSAAHGPGVSALQLRDLANDLKRRPASDTIESSPRPGTRLLAARVQPDPHHPILSVDGKQIETSRQRSATGRSATNNFFEFDQTRLAGHTTQSGTVAESLSVVFPVKRSIHHVDCPTRTYARLGCRRAPIVYFDSRFYELALPVSAGSTRSPTSSIAR